MLVKLIPLLIAIAGLGAGVGAGVAFRPAPEAAQVPSAGEDMAGIAPCGDVRPRPVSVPVPREPERESDFARMTNQFVFPLVEDGEVLSLMVLSLTLEVAKGQSDAALMREPKLRDGFLRVMLDHANAGGFRGAFTGNDSMENLRRALIEKGREDLGEALYDVLILDINRQDV